MRQSQKTYRISCAEALRPWGTRRSSASCDGQDGRVFSCEKVLLWTGLFAEKAQFYRFWRDSSYPLASEGWV